MTLKSGVSAFGVGDDPFAQAQPVAAAVPGRDPGTRARGDGQRECGACAVRLGVEQVADSVFGGVVLGLGCFDGGDVRDGGGDDCIPFGVGERLRG
ncbi:hypothetical protein Y013_24910 (plasmid) [Rhodococcus pyridinivorans SB3094]|uniref:Uncharacterized protein n=1 Tax=Rhodococcus pyridinivorans SB3094 TaxID=1435356 RepID=V9XQA8_9NOCA|nr:hypothetical protein Y013_24910 [Rhodococcus pyridinivorans SB3094]